MLSDSDGDEGFWHVFWHVFCVVSLRKQIFYNLVTGYKKKKVSTLSKLLEEAKKSNVPCRNLMTKEAIKDTIIKFIETIFDVNSSICIECLNEL